MELSFGGIYETIWTGGVDEIVGFKNGEIVVKDVETGKERTHMTSLNCYKLSMSSEPNSKENNLSCIVRLLEGGLPIHFFSNLTDYKKYAQIKKLVDKAIQDYNKRKGNYS